MAYWHEEVKWIGEIVRASADGAFRTHIRVTNQKVEPKSSELYFLRRQAEAAGRHPARHPELWTEYWPCTAAVFGDLPTAQAAAKEAIHQYDLGQSPWEGTEEKPYSPLRWEEIETAYHSDLRVKASLKLRSDGVFEVWYSEYVHVYEPRPGSPRSLRDDEWDWWRVRDDLLTLADSLEDARAIARVELEEAAANAGTEPIASRIGGKDSEEHINGE